MDNVSKIMSIKMKRTVLLLLVGCLVFSPLSFAGEEIQLAAAIGAGPSDNTPNPPPTQDNDRRDAAYLPGQQGEGSSTRKMTTALVATIGGLVAVAVLAVAGGKSSSSSSH